MQESALIALFTTLISLLITSRQGRLSNGFIRLSTVVLLWVAVQLGSSLIWPPGLPLWAEFSGHLLLWVVGLGIVLPQSLWAWFLPLGLVLTSLVVILPDITFELMRWGTVTAIPLIAFWTTPHPTEPDSEPENTFDQDAYYSQYLNNVGEVPLQPILERLEDGLIVADPQGNITYVNSHAATLLGLPAVDITGQSIMTVLARLPMMPASEQVEPARFEMNGRQIEGHLQLLINRGGELQGTLAILSDITGTFQTERTQRALLTSVTNELRTPLTAIKGYVDLLAGNQSGELSDISRSYLATIERNVSHMVSLINRLIFMSAVQDDQRVNNAPYTDLEQVIPQTLQELIPLAERQNLILTSRPAEDLRPIQVDALHFKTILQELVTNSIKFTEAGGTVKVVAELQEGQTPSDAFVVVRVVDSGIGIRPADQLHIFDEFNRVEVAEDAPVSQNNPGVGLAIVRALIEAYNGRIWLESEVGRGSQFTFVLPVVQKEEAVVALPSIG